MAIDCDPGVLSNASTCYNSCIPPGMQSGVAIYLLAQILKTQDPMVDVAPNTLITAARCYAQCIPPGMQMAVMNWLLCQIAANGVPTAGGTPQVFSGHGAPSGLQAGQSALLAAVYYDLDEGGMQYDWDITGGSWF